MSQMGNPIERIEKMGVINPSFEDADKTEAVKFKVFYKVFNVNDPTDNVELCRIKSTILSNQFAFEEERTFDKEGNWIVALNWYQEENV